MKSFLLGRTAMVRTYAPSTLVLESIQAQLVHVQKLILRFLFGAPLDGEWSVS